MPTDVPQSHIKLANIVLYPRKVYSRFSMLPNITAWPLRSRSGEVKFAASLNVFSMSLRK